MNKGLQKKIPSFIQSASEGQETASTLKKIQSSKVEDFEPIVFLETPKVSPEAG